jgi:hypothetical protein
MSGNDLVTTFQGAFCLYLTVVLRQTVPQMYKTFLVGQAFFYSKPSKKSLSFLSWHLIYCLFEY